MLAHYEKGPEWVKECRDGVWGIFCAETDFWHPRASEASADAALSGLAAADVKRKEAVDLWNNDPERIAGEKRAARKHGRTFVTSRSANR